MKSNNGKFSKSMKLLSIINEKNVKKGENINTKNLQIIIDKSENSICEIKCNDGYGTGFFCILRYPDKFSKIYCLITNYHVIDDDMINYSEYIEIKINNKEIKIYLNKKRKIWKNEEIDYTCIEIIKEDNIIENINPFDINNNCYNTNYDNNNYDEKGIIIASIASSKDIDTSQGILYYIKNNRLYFLHDCNTEGGFSGGPIILINNLSIIGIHKGYEKNEKKNVGIYLSEIINNINGIYYDYSTCELGIANNNEIEVGGKNNNNDNFNDLNIEKENFKYLIKKEKDNSLNDLKKGINILGKCSNKKCRFKDQQVISNCNKNKFEFISNLYNVLCPHCSCLITSKKIAFYQCSFIISGKKLSGKIVVPFSFNNIIEINDTHYFYLFDPENDKDNTYIEILCQVFDNF